MLSVTEIHKHLGEFTDFLAKAKVDCSKNQKTPQLQASKPTLLRSLFTLGLLCKQFDFDLDLKQQNQVGTASIFYTGLGRSKVGISLTI